MASNLPPEKPGKEQRYQITPPSIFLPKGGGAIRGIGEKFAANPVTGTGSMTVPIATSPGRSGFGPQLSISYHSGSGKGPFGFGWSLSLPSVTRKIDKGVPLYADGQDQVPDSDVFILSGAEALGPELEKDDAGTQGETRWAVTDAMTLLDTDVVTRRAVQPLLDEHAAQHGSHSPRNVEFPRQLVCGWLTSLAG
jgi:hypothetical protein